MSAGNNNEKIIIHGGQMKYGWPTKFVLVFRHLKSLMYDIYKNDFAHNTTMLSNC